MRAEHPLVEIILVQAVSFTLSWLIAVAFGHRLRRGHWTLSLALCGLIQWGSFALLQPTLGQAPWQALALSGTVVLLTVALTDHWNAIGQTCMASTLLLSMTFLVYIVGITVGAHLGPISLGFSFILILLQAFALVLLCAGSYEILDVLCRIRWRHVADPQPSVDYLPRVSLHVPAYNEPPEMVIETLDALARLDYPNYEVLVIDNNTTDEALWRPVEAHARKLGFEFMHLDNWPGFKSGALNYGLTRMDPATELVAIVDSDYVVEPDYLRRCVGFFRDPVVAFVQTPQDYRDVVSDDRYAVACYDAYRFFFKISMASRNEHNGIIFAGTMGLIRRDVLQQLGGWDEWCITEDAEISLRMLDLGLKGVYIDQSFGHGLMPLNFEGLKKQRFRWAFGGMQILRRHWGALVPWARWVDRRHKLSFVQQWDYLMGGLQWLNDPVTFAFTLLLLMGSLALIVAHALFVQPLAPAVMLVPFIFMFVGVSRFLWALRVRLRCGAGRALSAFMILLGLTWVVTLACVLGLVKRQGVFLRTPKKRTGIDPWHAMRIVSQETTIAALCAAAIVALLVTNEQSWHLRVMVGLLAWQCLVYSSALVSSVWGHRSEVRALHPQFAAASRSTGERVSSMVTGRPAGWAMLGAGLIGLAIYILGVRLAPESERANRLVTGEASLVPAVMIRPTARPEEEVKAMLYLERQSALQGDVEQALELWDPAGYVVDARNTDSSGDDVLWSGIGRVRKRYADEFARHEYVSLRHSDPTATIHGDTAIVVDDLRATIRTATGIQEVYLPRGDRWTLVRGARGWRIVSLELNRGAPQ